MRNTILLSLLCVAAWAAKPAVPKANVPVPPEFHNQSAGAAATSAAQWWRAFGDPLLDRLMARADQSNLDVRRAGARLAEAEALRKGSRATLLPDIGSTSSVTALRTNPAQGLLPPVETTALSSGFQMRWEIDVFRGLQKSVNAAGADAAA